MRTTECLGVNLVIMYDKRVRYVKTIVETEANAKNFKVTGSHNS